MSSINIKLTYLLYFTLLIYLIMILDLVIPGSGMVSKTTGLALALTGPSSANAQGP